MTHRHTHRLLLIAATLLLLAGCRHEDIIYIPDEVQVSRPEYTDITGFFLLNEGNMNSNKCTLDYYDYTTGTYLRNIFPLANPNVVMSMGDVGNDIQVYGNKMYAVVNCSNKVTVMERGTARFIADIEIPNCRYIRFHKGHAFVTSYAGPVVTDFNDDRTKLQQGYVARIDTTTLRVLDRCLVGYQPDELEIVDDRIYVANSGGYTPGHYETTVSVIDINAFKEVERIEIAPNLHRVRSDRRGVLWITSRGDHTGKVAPSLTAYDTRKRRVVARFDDYPVGDMWMDGDRLYTVGEAWNEEEQSWTGMAFRVIDTATLTLVNDHFITDGTDTAFQHPYGVAVNPITHDILVTDAMGYITPGWLRCYGQDGVLKWQVRTGDIPAHIVFYGKITQ